MNQSTRILLLLAFFCGCGYCVWTTPSLLASYPTTQRKLSSAVDSKGDSHLVYSVKVGSRPEVRYLKLAPSQKVISSHVFVTLKPASPSVATSADGKNVFLAYEDSSFLWFAESKDGGNVWSKPIKIPTETHFASHDPVLVYVQETGRLFIFCDKYYQPGWTVTYVSRASASAAFSPEKELAVPDVSGFTATYAVAKGVPIIQVFVSVHEKLGSRKGSLVQFTSENNGVTWTGPRRVAESVQDAMKAIVTTGPKGFMAVLYCNFDRWNLVVKYSEDAGKTWSPPFVSKIILMWISTGHVLNTIRVVADADGKVLRLFCFATPYDYTYTYSEWKFPEMTERILPTPFVDENDRGRAELAITAQRIGRNGWLRRWPAVLGY